MDFSQLLNNYERELVCQYKDETYSVRDNGAVFRHPKVNKKPRPTDNTWTFGKYNTKTGYAEIAGERVHRIVATAFHGTAPSTQYVVDHIDTNRRNNRPENLRWITKLENILLNPITVKKIEMVCGSIEEFLKDPSKLRQSYVDKDFEWMRAVTKEEASASLERMLSWAKNDNPSSSGSLGEWIYRRSLPKKTIEPEKILETTLSEISIADADKPTSTNPTIQEKKKVIKPKSNPFDFPRPNDSEDNVIMYRTNGELFGLLKAQLELEKTLKLPEIILSTAGKGIVIKESWNIEFIEFEFCYEGKSRIPKSIILHCENDSIALLIRREKNTNDEEATKLKNKGYNIVEFDLSWAKNGVTDTEMKYILQTDITKKKWIHHKQILEAREKLQQICEPISSSGNGVLHSYFACPLTSDSVQDVDCWYCDYRVDHKTSDCDYCFGKSGVQTYEDLFSIIKVEKEDDRIIGITYNKNGEEITKKFDKEVQLPGKTLLQLWAEKTGDEMIAHNIYSDWYVLIEEDPKACLDKSGCVYAKLGKNPIDLRNCAVRSIFSFDDFCWEIIQ